ncbi:MAG: AAA family ATPase [Candidatus Omnitrophica bacterium]|nr:AAA family ATPase [Candidatus Omnitrophota bacterium]
MYLKRLEIFGFKSFAEKTILDFQQGISAIVGPNGCGKSNVFDSVRWVLGEQSVKELRGSSMEDVIFNGTDKKPALGFAEVSLIFSNESKVLPFDQEEVVVTRRLFRSGESEYLINKTVCRLRDIVEMFLGTGVGAEAYSLIQQGKVDLVVSAKPDDRRQIFDEAAGITKYKAKKKEALSKLKEAEDNLVRLNDIVVEVKRQIATIERQAKKAQRYKEDFEQLKNFELILATHQMGIYTKEFEAITSALENFQSKEEEGLRQLAELNQQIEHETGLLEELDQRINEFKSQQIRLDNEIEVNVRQIGFNEERLQNIDQTISRLDTEKKACLERCGVHQGKIEEINNQLGQYARLLETLTQEVDEKRRSLSVLLTSIEEATHSIKSSQERIFTFNAQQVRVKNQLTDNMKRAMEQNARKSRLEHENSKVAQEKSQIFQKFEAINSAIVNVKNELEGQWVNLSQERQNEDGLKEQLGLCESRIDELEKSKVFLLSQKEFVDKMQRQYQENPDPVVEGRFIAPVRPSENQTGIIGKIKSIQEVEGGFEIIYETKYVELNLAHMDERIIAVEAQLAIENAQRDNLIQTLSEHRALIEGALKDIQQQEKKLSVLEAQKNDIELESGKIIGELDLINSEFSQMESALADLKVQEADLVSQLQGIDAEARLVQEEISDRQQDITRKHQEREDWNMAIVQTEAKLNALQSQQRNAQDNVNLHTQNLERDLSDISRFDSEALEVSSKRGRINEDIIHLQNAIEGLRTKKEALSVELNQCLAERAEVAQRLTSIRSHAKAIEDDIIQSKTDLHNLQMRQQELQFNQRTLKERLLQTYKVDWDLWQAQGGLTPQEPVATTEESAMSSQQVGGAAALEHVSAQPQPEVNFEELALEIERLKKRCESYGAVNLVAIEEFDELKNRFEYLTKQQSDLLTAREQLMQTIQKINRTTRQMFTDTFARVNEEFKTHFSMLFGGGEAELILLDPDNALESGIDIVARPPGKKLQNISLLSGGEKTMTAIALIFGVFKVNPSPFCVLDEIDAALDESNVGRFANLLKEFAKIAQFVVITHNKKTMAVADTMYGVTMQERGISRIVSVKFNEYQHQAPSARIPQSVENAVAV